MIQKILQSEKNTLLVSLLLVYGFHFLIRIFAAQNFGDSDGYQALASSFLKVGYQPGSGPFYTWLLYFVVNLLGYSVASFLVLKYALIFCIYFLFYFLYLVFSSNKRWALWASLSLGSCYFLMWRVHEVMTDKLLTTCLSLMIILYYFSYRRMGNSSWRVWGLGALFGAGFLTEMYIFFVVSSIALIGLRRDSGWRKIEIFQALFIGAVISIPFYFWLFEVGHFSSFVIGINSYDRNIDAYWRDLKLAVLHPVYVLSPALLIFLPFFLFKKREEIAADANLSDVGEFVNFLGLCCLSWILFFGFLFPAKNNEVLSALPVFLPALVLVILKLEDRDIGSLKMILILSILPVVAIFFRFGNLLVHEPFCRNCRWAIPYDKLAMEIKDCISPNTDFTIYSKNVNLLANLKRHYPNVNYIIENDWDAKLHTPSSGHHLYLNDETLLKAGVMTEASSMAVLNNQKLLVIKWAEPYFRYSKYPDRLSSWHLTLGPSVDPACVNSKISKP